jgi:hypothetical protein
MMSTDNIYGTFCAEPSCEDAWDESYIDVVAPYGSENIDDTIPNYEYSDGYER